ncbi:hypothetical protein V8C35DRAFT_286688 [Trichoderma chlorosporum]
MSSSINRRHRRPAIEPIQTGHGNILHRSHGFSRRRLSPLSGSIPTEFHSVDSAVSDLGSRRRGLRFAERRAPKKFHVPETTSDAYRVISPGFRPTHFGPYLRHSTVVESPFPARAHHIPGGIVATSVPCSPNTLRMSLYLTLPPGYTLISPCCESDIRRRRLADIQRSRLRLWEQGSKRFGSLEDADVFVRPLPLRKYQENLTSLSEDNTPSPISPSSPLQSPASSSPASVSSRRLSVRAIIHSKSHPPIGLKREFDLDRLRATIPDPLPSPQSPNFNPEALLSNLAPLNRKRRASCLSDSISANDKEDADEDGKEAIDCDEDEAAENVSSPRPSKRRRFPEQLIAVPINIQYARAHLPALAAVMMSDQVKQGDTIQLALPQPQAWPETVAYVYTGEAQLLTEETKENIFHLGGKVGKEVAV